ncbi:MAG: electron transport complex subunit E [Clostridiales bacterium]|nr:electron transport complex subunit E [Clostridiales bacterium]
MNVLSELKRGVIIENPLFVLVLGTCPALALTTSVTNALGMGAAFTGVLICSNLVISLIRKFVPNDIRIPSYIVVIASFVTLCEMVMNAFTPALFSALGIFIPLIVVNCVILGRAEAYAGKNGPLASIVDGVVMGLGYTCAIALMAAIREVLGAGAFMGFDLFGPSYQPVLVMILPAGAFITMGFLFALFAFLKNRRSGRSQKQKRQAKGVR